MLIITYHNFSLPSFVISSWWSLHTATFRLLPLLSVHDDHYIPQLFSSLLCYNFMMIITYRNFSVSSFVITSWWSLHTATFPLLSFLSVHDDHYIPQLYHFFLCYNFIMIITYRNFFHFFLCYNFMMIITYRNFFHFFLCYNFIMIITYRNLFTSSFVITLWWSLRTATFPLLPFL